MCTISSSRLFPSSASLSRFLTTRALECRVSMTTRTSPLYQRLTSPPLILHGSPVVLHWYSLLSLPVSAIATASSFWRIEMVSPASAVFQTPFRSGRSAQNATVTAARHRARRMEILPAQFRSGAAGTLYGGFRSFPTRNSEAALGLSNPVGEEYKPGTTCRNQGAHLRSSTRARASLVQT